MKIRIFLLLLPFIFFSLPAPAADLDSELAYRVAYGSAKDVEILLGQGASANAIAKSGLPLVSVAAMRADGESVPVIEKLVAAGADLNAGADAGQPPIIIAARNNNYDLVKYLISQNVDTSVTDRSGSTAKTIAEYNSNNDILVLLQEQDAKREQELAELRSPERYTKLFNQLVFEYCASQYLSYYVKSKQDKLSPEESDILLSEQNGKVSDIHTALYKDFNVDVTVYTQMREDVQGRIFDELEQLISNRNRKINGVGKPSDMKKRCNRISEKWLNSSAAPAAF